MKVTNSNVLAAPLPILDWLFKPGQTEQALLPSPVPAAEALDRHKLEERLGEIQRNDRCVWRAVQLMVFLTAVAIAGVGYTTVLIPDSDWPQTLWQFLMLLPIKANFALGLASLSCACVFSALGMFYRRELTGLRLAYARLISEITEPANARLIPLPVASSAQSSSAENGWIEQPALFQQAA